MQQILQAYGPLIAVMALGIGLIATLGWVFTTWLRIKHGYPLDGAWGQAIYPKSSDETVERIKLISTENAQLRAELGSIKDRLETLERIATEPRDSTCSCDTEQVNAENACSRPPRRALEKLMK